MLDLKQVCDINIMKSIARFCILIFFLLSACNSTESIVQTSVAGTLTAQPTKTILVRSTYTPRPTITPIPTFDIERKDLGILLEDMVSLYSKEYGFSFTPLEKGDINFLFLWDRDLKEDEVGVVGTDKYDSTMYLISRQNYLVYAYYTEDLGELQYISSPSIYEFGKTIFRDPIFDQVIYPLMIGEEKLLCIGNVVINNSMNWEIETISIQIAMKADVSELGVYSCD